MNRTDRLLAIVLELQARGKQRAEDLAVTFEVGKRTIYRDIQALCEAGVPVISTPGQGYALLDGYFLPPLRFTPDEALILLLGGDAMAQSFDAEYRAAAESAGRKIAGALPEPLRDQVRSLQASIRFVADSTGGRPEQAESLRQLRRAIVGRHSLRFRYHARHPHRRPVWPGACRWRMAPGGLLSPAPGYPPLPGRAHGSARCSAADLHASGRFHA
jgi:predicted DNA-binding transcriptional regulator YafY